METPKFLLRLIRIFGVWHYYIILKPIKKPKSDDWCTLLLFEGIDGIPMCALFFPLDFEGKIH